MSTIWRIGLCLSALITSLFNQDNLPLYGQESPRLVLRKMLERESPFETVSATWKQTETFVPSGDFSSSDVSLRAEGISFANELTFAWAGQSWKRTRSGKMLGADEDDAIHGHTEEAWHDNESRTFSNIRDSLSGAINGSAIPVSSMIELTPLAIALRPVQWLEINASNCTLGESELSDCWLLIQHRPGTTANMYWVLKSNGGLVRMERWRKNRLVVSVELEYSADQQGFIEYLAGWRTSLVQNRGVTSIDAAVNSIELNHNISADAFEITFPPGTLVDDSIRELSYVVKPDSSHRAVTRGELARGANSEDLLSTEPGMAKHDSYNEYRYLYIIGAFSAIVVALVCYRVLGRQTGRG